MPRSACDVCTLCGWMCVKNLTVTKVVLLVRPHKTFCFIRDKRITKTQKGLTCVYWAMGLDSTAYTLVAPAWTAKKDRMPEPQHTSRTTYQGRRGKKQRLDFLTLSRYSLTVVMQFSPKPFRKCELLTERLVKLEVRNYFFLCNELLNIVKPPRSKNIYFRMIGDSKLLLALSDPETHWWPGTHLSLEVDLIC